MMNGLTTRDHPTSISSLQARAWAIANAGYGVPEGDAYRAYARELYEEDLHERILALFARLDSQNVQVEAILRLHHTFSREPAPPVAQAARTNGTQESCKYADVAVSRDTNHCRRA